MLKRRYGERSDWKRILQRKYAQSFLDTKEFKGHITFSKRLSIITTGTILLMSGIIILLFIFHFPVLGPAVSDSFSFLTTVWIFIFAFLYSWLWVEIALNIFKRVKMFIK